MANLTTSPPKNQTAAAFAALKPDFSASVLKKMHRWRDKGSYADEGLGEGRFRIPSLRNIALTAPYMHDGRFATLGEVIDHYDHGIQAHPALDKNLRNNDGTPKRMNLNPLEKQALIAFLNTLTDETVLTDQRFSNPFK